MTASNLMDILDNLLSILDTDPNLFHKTYRSLPYSVYSEIEKLSLSCQKPHKQKESIKKAKVIAGAFHKKFNTKQNERR